jgi:hypothetical protein
MPSVAGHRHPRMVRDGLSRQSVPPARQGIQAAVRLAQRPAQGCAHHARPTVRRGAGLCCHAHRRSGVDVLAAPSRCARRSAGPVPSDRARCFGVRREVCRGHHAVPLWLVVLQPAPGPRTRRPERGSRATLRSGVGPRMGPRLRWQFGLAYLGAPRFALGAPTDLRTARAGLRRSVLPLLR